MWQKVVCKTGIWLAAEIWLNLMGLDNIADYGEFLLALEGDLNLKNRRTVKINEYPPQFCPKIEHLCPLPGTVTHPTDLIEHGCTAQAEIFANKCQQLAEPCLKISCLATKIELDR